MEIVNWKKGLDEMLSCKLKHNGAVHIKLGDVDFNSNSKRNMLTSIGNHYMGMIKEDVPVVAGYGSSVMSTEGIGSSRKVKFTIKSPFYENGDKTSQVLKNKYDIMNALKHEAFHYKNHENTMVDPNFGGLTSSEREKASIHHLDAFKAQVQDDSWKNTSETYKQHIEGAVNIFIGNIGDKNKKSEFQKFFKGYFKNETKNEK